MPRLGQHAGARRGVRRVRRGRDDPHARRQGSGDPGADHPGPGAGDDHVGLDRREQLAGRSGRAAVVQDAGVAMRAAQGEQPLDVQPGRVGQAPGHGGDRGHPAAAASDLPGHSAAHLAEPLDGHRTPVPVPAPPGPQRCLGRRRDAVSGQHILERHSVHDGADRGRRGPVRAQRGEVLLGRAHVRPGEQPAAIGQRGDLGAEPGHQLGLARAVRRIPAHARLGPARLLAKRGELVGHGPGQQRHLSRADVRRQPGSAGGLRRAGQVEHHEAGDRAQLEDLRSTGKRFACHAPPISVSAAS